MSGSEGQIQEVRTSTNTWVHREKSPIVDAIYRRAADLFRIDEALFRKRSADEFPSWPCKETAAESLQLVHYEVGQKYIGHHDFRHPHISDENRRTRFATLLLYLNEGMKGGETSFPRWVNAETSDQLKVVPKIGKVCHVTFVSSNYLLVSSSLFMGTTLFDLPLGCIVLLIPT